MKKFWILCLPVIILLGSCGSGNVEKGKMNISGTDTVSLAGSIKICGPQTMHSMMTKWSTEFNNANPQTRIGINDAATEMGIETLFDGRTDLAIIGRPLTQDEKGKGLWSAAVALDAIVPVISFENDNIQRLTMNGLTKGKLTGAFTGKIKNWGALTGKKTNDPLQVFVQSDSAGSTYIWQTFLGLKSGEMKGTKSTSEEGMIKSLAETKSGIGYCSIRSIYDLNSGFLKKGIYVVPIDFNGNGIIDDNEQYYDKFSLISNAITTGKMPMPPARELYIVTKSKPTNKVLIEFIKWLLTIGQNYMPEMGYINIQKEKATAALETLK